MSKLRSAIIAAATAPVVIVATAGFSDTANAATIGVPVSGLSISGASLTTANINALLQAESAQLAAIMNAASIAIQEMGESAAS